MQNEVPAIGHPTTIRMRKKPMSLKGRMTRMMKTGTKGLLMRLTMMMIRMMMAGMKKTEKVRRRRRMMMMMMVMMVIVTVFHSEQKRLRACFEQ